MADDKQWFQKPEQPDNRGNDRRHSGSPARKNPKSSGNPRNSKNPRNANGKSLPASNRDGKPRPTGKRPDQAIHKDPNHKRVQADGKQQAKVVHTPNPSKRPDRNVPSKKKVAPVNKKIDKKKPEKNIAKKNVAKKNEIPPKKEITKEEQVKASFTKDQEKRTRRRGLRNGIVSVFVVAITLFVLVFVVYHLKNYIADKPEFTFVSRGSIEHTIGARALIVRDEDILFSSATGDLVTQATEGSRVATGQRIGMVVPQDLTNVVDNLRNTQSQISEVQQELIQQGSAVGADVIYKEINGNIEPLVDNIRRGAMDGNIGDLSSYQSSINVLLDQRENELAELSFDDERLRVLRADEAGYENQLERRASAIVASTPGVVSFRLDGQEQALSFDLLLNADPSAINDIISSSAGIITSDLNVNTSDPVVRIARNQEQYLAVMLDDDDANASAFAVGTMHDINVGSEGISIENCEVMRNEVTRGGMLVVFRTTRYVEDLLDLRTVDIEIVITQSTGLRVPITSLVDPDYTRGVANIYINNKGFCDSVGVIIVDYDREFAIVEPIGDSTVPNTHTVLITNPSSINPGEKVTN